MNTSDMNNSYYSQSQSQSQLSSPKEEAIPLITYEPESRQFVINEEAIDFIKTLKGPIGIVAVAGLYRTGKSYLLNRMLLNRQQGFGVGPSVNPCTKGLWIWNKPIIGQTAEGDPVNVLIVDSEGIGALDEDSQHDNTIFALTILLSSCFIYNSTGSIDENALQNLSLVVNLTKNIQVKSAKQSDDIDSIDYSTYFPQFVWVVRDFTLQLIDQDGEQITSKDYLERALQIQKGFSDSVESKNRIRRLLQTFFKERDCFCLVRPLTNEENLQNLDKMELHDLRQEFAEQVCILRKKILNRIKVKEINKRALSGEMFTSLIQNYVKAINEGAVPNIENAWSYICKNECLKAVFEASENYDCLAKELIMHKIPLSLDDLKKEHQIAKEQTYKIFKKKAMGEVSEEFLKELAKKIKEKWDYLKAENEKESKRICSQWIKQQYLPIEEKIKNNIYQVFQDYQRDLKHFVDFFLQNAPPIVNRYLTLMEHLFKFENDYASQFIRKIKDELDLQQMMYKELQKKLETESKEHREDFQREQQSLLMKIAQLEHNKTEMEMQNQSFKEKIQSLEDEFKSNERQMKTEQQQQKKNYEQIISDLEMKLQNCSENLKENDRQSYMVQSEHEKEKALLMQKVSYLEKALDEQIKKDKDSSAELKMTKKALGTQIKDTQTKFEEKIKQLQSELQKSEEKMIEMENELKIKEQQVEMERKKWNLNENNFTNQIQDSKSIILQLTKENKELKAQEEKNQDILKMESSNNNLKANQQIQDLSVRLKEKEDENKGMKSNFEKDKAVLSQKLEFSELQLKELKKQLVENKEAHSKILKAFEFANNESLSKVDNKQIQEIKDGHKKEFKQLQTEFDVQKRRLVSQLETTQEKCNDLDLQWKLSTAELEKERQNLQEQQEQMEKLKQKFAEQNKSIESQKAKIIKEMEDRSSQKIKQLEQTIEEMKQKSMLDIKDHQIESEESLTQLKNFFELEKERLEQKLLEDKSNQDKKNHVLIEEYEIKLREEAQNYEEEIDQLKDEYRELEQQNQMSYQNYEQQMALKNQQIETLEKYMKETKESLTNNQQNYNIAIEQYQQKHQLEIKEITEQSEKVKIELIRKDKELINSNQKIEMLADKMSKKEEEFMLLNNELKDTKDQMVGKIEELREKYQKLADEYLEKKIEYGRESALNNQQIEFNSKKIEDLKKLNEELVNRNEEKFNNAKSEFQQEMIDKMQILNSEKDVLAEKYEKTKKSLKQNELTFNSQLGQLERERALALQKVQTLEAQKQELENRSSIDSQHLLSQLNQLKETFGNERKNYQSEVESLHQKISEIETERNSLIANYERDKALWEEKFKFLEEQKENAKKEVAETTQKFEQSLSMLNSQKQAFSSHSLEQAIATKSQELEQQFQEQQMNLQQQGLMQQQQFDEKQKKYEKEIRQLNEQLLLLQHGKFESQQFQQKRMQELQDETKQLTQDIEAVKNEQDIQLQKQSQQFDVERKLLKSKLLETESKLKETENKRTQFLFEREKDLTKWNMEKDQWVNKCNDLQDQLERIERKREVLLRENERLKGESRGTRKNLGTFSQQQQFSHTQKQQQMLISRSQLNNNNTEKNLNDITNALQEENTSDMIIKEGVIKNNRPEIENSAALTYNFNFDRMVKK